MARQSAGYVLQGMVVDAHAMIGAGGVAPGFDLPLLFLGFDVEDLPQMERPDGRTLFDLADFESFVGARSPSFASETPTLHLMRIQRIH